MSGEITENGINAPSEVTMVERCAQYLRTNVDPTLDTGPYSAEGAIIRAVVPEIGAVWEALQDLAGQLDPRTATGKWLAQLGALNSLFPDPARATRVTCNLTLSAGVTVPKGARVSVAGNAAISGTLIASVTSITAGTYTGVFDLETKGAITVNAGTFSNILTPITGWTACTNPLDGVTGAAAETDEAFRVRRAISLGKNGGNALSTLRAKLVDLDGVASVTIYENTLALAVGALPAHSFEVLIDDSGLVPNDTIAQTIFDTVSGNLPVGFTSGTAYETIAGVSVSHSIRFSRPTSIPIYVSVTVTGGSTSAIVAAIKALNASVAPGIDVLWGRVSAAVFGALSGEQRITSLFIGVAAAPTGTSDISIGDHEKAAFDTSRIVVTGAT